jgi:hypothetical protein
MCSSKLKVKFMLEGVEHEMLVEDAFDLIHQIRTNINALRQKCPTCRCHILPGSECACCAQPDVPDLPDIDS